MVNPSIRTDGYQLHLTLTDLSKPKDWQKKFLEHEGDVDDEDDDEETEECDSDGQKGGGCKLKPLTEISRYLAKSPERSTQIRTIMAADEGILFPIDVSVVSMPEGEAAVGLESQGQKRRMRVRKGCLYKYENQESAKLEYLKDMYKDFDVHEAELELGSTGSKNSMSLEDFRAGYLQAWANTSAGLFKFYSSVHILANRMHLSARKQSLYDSLCHKLFCLMGVRQELGLVDSNRTKLVVLGQQKLSTRHYGSRHSQHAAFWNYFRTKCASLGVDVVGLVEHRSSKVCMSCCQHIIHDPQKRHRVYKCDHCNMHVHRDDSSAEIHCAVAWCEVVHYSQALALNQLPKYDPEDPTTVKYFRPLLFQPKWMMASRTANDNGIQDPADGIQDSAKGKPKDQVTIPEERGPVK